MGRGRGTVAWAPRQRKDVQGGGLFLFGPVDFRLWRENPANPRDHVQPGGIAVRPLHHGLSAIWQSLESRQGRVLPVRWTHDHRNNLCVSTPLAIQGAPQLRRLPMEVVRADEHRDDLRLSKMEMILLIHRTAWLHLSFMPDPHSKRSEVDQQLLSQILIDRVGRDEDL